MADDIWIYDIKSKKIENATNHPAQDIIPKWKGNKIYFLSDRDENAKMNLFVYYLETKETRKLTDFTEFDIKFPSIGPGAVVFENGGYIYRLDTETNQTQKVPVYISGDLTSSRSRIAKVQERISNYEISPDGNRALFGARGDVFTVPAKHGNTRNLTGTSGIHERNSKWSPDGQWIAFSRRRGIIDGIFVIKPDGTGMRQLSETGGWPVWWPDGKQLGYQNYGKDGSLEISTIPLAGGPPKALNFIRYRSTNNPFDISPDGTRLATTDRKVVSSDIWLLKPRP